MIHRYLGKASHAMRSLEYLELGYVQAFACCLGRAKGSRKANEVSESVESDSSVN